MNGYSSILALPQLPCHFGPMPTPQNFSGLPNVLGFELGLDLSIGILRQSVVPGLNDMLDKAYRAGNVMGTPLAEDDFGLAYVHDFLDFVEREAIQGRKGLRILEVGAGAGFISHSLKVAGHNVTSIEPGGAYRPYWERYGIDVINDYFPSAQAPGPYDIVISYAVLEHIDDATGFLEKMAAHLAPGGLVVAAVPNDSEEIVTGDPGMLVHEHFYYFMPTAFRRLLESGGLAVQTVQEAQHSRVLFSVSSAGGNGISDLPDDELAVYKSYGEKFQKFRANAAAALQEAKAAGRSIGIYCPARALAVLPIDLDARFFDDAPYNKGQFYPPFTSRIEGKEGLVDNPVDEMWIMSRSFGDVILNAIKPMLPNCLIRHIKDFEN